MTICTKPIIYPTHHEKQKNLPQKRGDLEVKFEEESQRQNLLVILSGLILMLQGLISLPPSTGFVFPLSELRIMSGNSGHLRVT